MKTLTSLAVITFTSVLFGASASVLAEGNQAGNNDVQTGVVQFGDLDLANPNDAQSLGPNNTPNGYCGALNMIVNWAVKAIGMSHDAAQGDAGMYHAIDVSDCR